MIKPIIVQVKAIAVSNMLLDGVINSCIFQLKIWIKIKLFYGHWMHWKILLERIVPWIWTYYKLRVGNNLWPFSFYTSDLIICRQWAHVNIQMLDKIRCCAKSEYCIRQLKCHVRWLWELGSWNQRIKQSIRHLNIISINYRK